MTASDVVVIGAGQAGLAVSHHLAAAGIEHQVLERGVVGETWRRQRWDSFALNTPSWYSLLPGDEAGLGDPDGFAHRDDYVTYLASYASRLSAPVRTGLAVTGIRPRPGGGYDLATSDGPLSPRAVVVATGGQNRPRVPPVARDLPGDVHQLHSSAYRSAAVLPNAAVLVIGSAQSGVQIAEDLVDAGREVFLATSAVGRTRRRYRGRDVVWWLKAARFFDVTAAQLPNPAMLRWPLPQISGLGPRGHTLSLQVLEARGVRLLGRADGVRDGRLVLRDDLGANLAWADNSSAQIARMIENLIATQNIDAGDPEDDPADAPHPDPTAVHAPESLDLVDAGISTVIWTTGVAGDFSWLPAEALDSDGLPAHSDGVSVLPGLYFLGLPWLRNRGSGIIHGTVTDAAFLAATVASDLGAARATTATK